MTDWPRLTVLQAERAWLATEMERLGISRAGDHKLAHRFYDIQTAISEGIVL